MASRIGPYTIRKEFKHLIFSDTLLTAATCAPAFNDLLRDANQASRVLSDRTVVVMFLSNFDKYAERIFRFFRKVDEVLGSVQAKRNVCVGSDLPDALTSGILARLLTDEFGQFQTRRSFQSLFSSIVDFCLAFRSAQFGMLAKALGENEQLLELLVSGENSGQVMRKLVHAFNAGSPVFVSNVFAAWVKRLVALCDRCDGNHLVSEHLDTWRELQGLIVRLTEVLNVLTSTSEKASEIVTQEDKDLLGNFGIAPPASERALQNVLEKLQREETVKVLRVLADSFPCRPCYQASMGDPLVKATTEAEFQTGKQATGPVSFTGLFGTGLGIWRICISAQALKDLEQSRSEGTSQKVRN